MAELLDSPLRGDVSRILRQHERRAGRGQVDDPAALGHSFRRFLAGEKRTLHVHGEEAVELLLAITPLRRHIPDLDQSPSLANLHHDATDVPSGFAYDRRVVDFSLEAVERKAKRATVPCDTSNALYLGVEVPKNFVQMQLTVTGFNDSFAELFYAKPVNPRLEK